MMALVCANSAEGGLGPNVQCSGTLNCIVQGAQSSEANQRPELEASDQWEAAMEAPLAQYIAETVTKLGFMWSGREQANAISDLGQSNICLSGLFKMMR